MAPGIIKTPFFYGWIVVFVAALQRFWSGPGQTYNISSFTPHYIKENRWDVRTVSFCYGAATTISGLTMVFVGRGVDKFGPRYSSIATIVLLSAACMFNTVIKSYVSLFIGFFLLRFSGQGCMTLIPAATVPHWFFLKRGRALALMNVGGVLSAVVFPTMSTALINAWGYASVWRFYALMGLVTFLPCAFFLLRDSPENHGLRPDGFESSVGGEGVDHHEEAKWTLSEAFRTRAFWILSLCNLERAAINTAITFHHVDLMAEHGMTEVEASSVISIMGFVGLPVAFVMGFVVERVALRYVLSATFIFQALMLFILTQANSLSWGIVAGIIWGMAAGFEQMGFSIVWPNYFGRASLGAFQGVNMSVLVVGSALGPVFYGMGYHATDSFQSSLYWTIPIALLCMFLCLIAHKPHHASEPQFTQLSDLRLANDLPSDADSVFTIGDDEEIPSDWSDDIPGPVLASGHSTGHMGHGLSPGGAATIKVTTHVPREAGGLSVRTRAARVDNSPVLQAPALHPSTGTMGENGTTGALGVRGVDHVSDSQMDNNVVTRRQMHGDTSFEL